MTPSPLILTVKLDTRSFGFFNALREKHFPPARNFLKAHVTLFHHLPGAEISIIKDDLRNICADYQNFELKFPTLRFLGKGTAAGIESTELLKLRAVLAVQWKQWLNEQDRQKFKPHITIQNKVAPTDARKFYEEMRALWNEKIGSAVGLQLWHYENGPWRLAEEFSFEPSGER